MVQPGLGQLLPEQPVQAEVEVGLLLLWVLLRLGLLAEEAQQLRLEVVLPLRVPIRPFSCILRFRLRFPPRKRLVLPRQPCLRLPRRCDR